MKDVIPLYRLELVRSGEVPWEKERDCRSARDVYHLVRRIIGDASREHVIALYLDTQRQLIAAHVVSVGSVAEAILTGAEVFKGALLCNATSLVLAHNHPSGECAPSPQDLARTEALEHAGVLLSIPLLDHVIVGHQRYYSFRAAGKLALPDADWALQAESD